MIVLRKLHNPIIQYIIINFDLNLRKLYNNNIFLVIKQRYLLFFHIIDTI